MGSEWKQYRLSDVIDLIGGGTPKRSHPEYWGGEIPWLSVKDFNNDYRQVFEAEETITKKGLENSSTKLLYPGQLIISARGTVGALAQLVKPMAFNQSCYGITAKNHNVTNDFLYYLLKFTVANLRQITHGAVFDTITRETFNYVTVALPPLPEQRAIAHILGSLDDKIELNRQMNRTLEKMAQAIFKSWFIDFDPVRARRGESLCSPNYSLPKEIADLFPDSFEDSELGQIPKGWRVKTLSSIIELIGGGTPKTKVVEYWNGDIPWFSVVDAPNESDLWVIDTEKHVTQTGIENSPTKILPIRTTIISARGTVGKCALVGRPMAMNQSCYGIRPADGYGEICTNFTVRNQIMALQRSGHGSVFNTITRATFDSIQIADGGCEISTAFDKSVDSYVSTILENLHEAYVLIRLRDTLLPKLISGELRLPAAVLEELATQAGVPNTERIVERCV